MVLTVREARDGEKSGGKKVAESSSGSSGKSCGAVGLVRAYQKRGRL